MTQPAPHISPLGKDELKYAAGWAAVVAAVTCIPFLVVWWFTPLDAVYPWLLYNSDDHGVYFAWMRQARDGHVLFRNLFTTEPQRGIYFHLYFLVLGWLSRLPGLDIPLTYHLARVVFGIVTLVLAYRLGALFTADRFARRCIFWTVALSSGLGWLFWTNTSHHAEPVDVWQPEAITFFSLYTNGLFTVSLALMLGVVVCLLIAETRGARWAVGAGVCGLLLGNIHSYDVIHLTIVWVLYLLLRAITQRQLPRQQLRLAIGAALVAAPSVAYMAWLYLTEPVFKARADTATWSPSPLLYALGYGLLIPLAVYGGGLLLRTPDPGAAGGSPLGEPRPCFGIRLLPVAWAIGGVLAAYLRFAFQRKMVMGEHIPLALMAGLAIAHLSTRAADGAGQPRLRAVLAVLCIGLLAPTNVRHLLRDAPRALRDNITSTLIHPVFWDEQTIHAWEWLGKNTPTDAALLCIPFHGVLVPAYSARAVYAGHWGETPGWNEKIGQVARFYDGRMASAERLELIRDNRITHVMLGPVERSVASGPAALSPPLDQEPYLREAWREGETVLLEVVR